MLSLLALSALLLPLRGRAQCASDFDWSSIAPSLTLNWTECYSDGLQCTRLSVPLDYNNSTDEQAVIAMVRIPSPYGLNGSSEYRGPLLYNPGGPGGSGVSAIVGDTTALQARIGDKYDLIGFDPRGIGRSTPTAMRFPTPLAAALWGENSLHTVLPPLSIQGNLGLTLAKAEVSNAIYAQTGSSYLPFINTPFTAQDMLQVIQAHGFEKINYYGISYGTILGAVFATMFPDKIERMVLDGVADTEQYFHGNITAELLDTDKAVDAFLQSCFEAGPDLCAFYDSSPEKISANLDALYERLKVAPIAANDGTNYGVVDYGFLRHTLREFSYSPYQTFQPLGQALALLAQGNASLLFSLNYVPLESNPCSCGVSDPNINTVDAFLTISCNDGDTQNRTLEEWEGSFSAAANVSAYSEVFAGLAMRCQSWPVTTKNPVRGPWGGNTTNPILFIGNTADPVTPLVGAKKMSSLFPGSTTLTQNSSGHTSISATSECTTGIVIQYFENATLPADNTVCEVEGSLFPPLNSTSGS